MTTLQTLRKQRVKSYILSRSKIITAEDRSFAVSADYTFTDALLPDVTRYDGFLIISGHPKDSQFYWHYKPLQQVIETYADKPVGAICSSVVSIRHIAKGRRVAAYPTIDAKDLLAKAGCIYSQRTLEVDGNIVTAEVDLMAGTWIEAYLRVLHGETVEIETTELDDFRRHKPRKPIKALRHLGEQNGS